LPTQKLSVVVMVYSEGVMREKGAKDISTCPHGERLMTRVAHLPALPETQGKQHIRRKFDG
jgi:hypothetical protein